jgi:hypothetical protein
MQMHNISSVVLKSYANLATYRRFVRILQARQAQRFPKGSRQRFPQAYGNAFHKPKATLSKSLRQRFPRAKATLSKRLRQRLPKPKATLSTSLRQRFPKA